MTAARATPARDAGGTAVVCADASIGYAARLLRRLGFRVVVPGWPANGLRVPPRSGPAARRLERIGAWYFGEAEGSALDPFDPACGSALADLLGARDVAVFVEPWTDPERAALGAAGASEAAIRERNRDLVWVSVTPYGRGQSPERRSAVALFAESGFMSVSGPAGGAPCAAPGMVAYDMAGAHAVLGALACLERARRGGGGGSVDVSILECLAVCEHVISRASMEGRPVPRTGTQHESASPGRVFAALDGWVHIMIAPSSAGHWERFRRWCDDPRLDDPAFADPGSRRRHADALAAIVSEHTRRVGRADLLRLGMELGIPIAPVHGLGEFLASPHEAGRLRTRQVGATRLPDLPDWTRAVDSAPPPRRPPAGGPPGSGGGPLAGVTVLDFSHILAGPYASLLLGYLGATVLKVESPSQPDGYRRRHGERGLDASRPFADFNRNKRGITADLKTEEGRRKVLALLPHVDVLLENHREGTLQRAGLGWADVQARNPSLSVVTIRGLGAGPWSALAAYGPTIQAVSGLTHLWNPPGTAEPVGTQGSFADYVAGIHAAVACLAAIRAAAADGRGRYVEIPMAESIVALLGPLAAGALTDRHEPAPAGNLDPLLGPAEVVRCADGRWACVLPGAPAQPAGPGELQATAGRLPAEALLAACDAAGQQAALVQDGLDLLRDGRLAARGFLVPVDHPHLGRITFPGCPIQVAGWSAPMCPAPSLGADDAWLVQWRAERPGPAA